MGACPCAAGVAKTVESKPSKPVASSEDKQNDVIPAPLETKKQNEVGHVPLEAKRQNEVIPLPPEAIDPTPPAPVSAPPLLPDPVSADSTLSAGCWVDIYSNSFQAWCPGIIFDSDATSFFAAYQVPGEPSESNINTKTLPLDSPEIRRAADNGAWSHATVEVVLNGGVPELGRVHDFSGGYATIKDLTGEKILATLPTGDQKISLPGAENALTFRQGPLTVGSPVEVFSHSNNCWCYGVVQSMRYSDDQGLAIAHVIVAFFYPDMDPQKEDPAMKELPIGHPDLRSSGSGVEGMSPVTEADLQLGTPVEAFSESRATWLPGIVKDIQDGNVTLLLKYPDLPEDSNLFEKDLPIGHAFLRLPAV